MKKKKGNWQKSRKRPSRTERRVNRNKQFNAQLFNIAGRLTAEEQLIKFGRIINENDTSSEKELSWTPKIRAMFYDYFAMKEEEKKMDKEDVVGITATEEIKNSIGKNSLYEKLRV